MLKFTLRHFLLSPRERENHLSPGFFVTGLCLSDTGKEGYNVPVLSLAVGFGKDRSRKAKHKPAF